MENKGPLDPVALGDEDEVVASPQREVEASDVSLREVVFETVLVDDDALEGQRPTDPLRRRSARAVRKAVPKGGRRSTLTLYTSLLSSSSVGVPVTRVKPAKNHSATMLIESAVGRSASSRGWLVAL